ncbi:MAG: potassium channel family protein [Pseudomonadota bacterium]
MTLIDSGNSVFFRNRFAVLFFLLFAVLLIPPFFENTVWIAKIWRSLFTLVLLWALYAASNNRRLLLFAVLLLIPTLATTWMADTGELRVVAYIDNFTNIAYFGLVSVLLGRYLLHSRRVTVEVIFAAMCLYMILAILWAAVFSNIELFYSNAFLFRGEFAEQANVGPEDLLMHLTYYSFVTLSTLGYGDILPANLVARNWAAMEAMIGQFFIAIVIARLVSIYSQQSEFERADQAANTAR